MTSIHWFSRDLRLADNPALSRAASQGMVLPVFVWGGVLKDTIGGASRWWLESSLKALCESTQNALVIQEGDPADVMMELVQAVSATHVTMTQAYDPDEAAEQAAVANILRGQGVIVQCIEGNLLWRRTDVRKSNGEPYRVFSPFYRKGCLSAPAPRQPLPKPTVNFLASVRSGKVPKIASRLPWTQSLSLHWVPGEHGARARLHDFIDVGLTNYKNGRNIPNAPNVSRLSPHLAWGEISPHSVWYAAEAARQNGVPDRDVDHFHSELAWREFSYTLLEQEPKLRTQNWNAKFDAFPWRSDESALQRWQKGQTGIPIVDAGMRELWATGYMHNRVRMIVGSFLVKNLLLHWQHGEEWFWDTLVDADPANNPAGWQWVAGSGADAAPYFRIFNPVGQAEKFDPEGRYIQKWVPELASLPAPHLFAPWEAPPMDLQMAGITLGFNYPHPLVDLKESRERALQGYSELSRDAAAE